MSMKAAGSAVAAKPDCNLTGDMLIRSPWRDEYQGGGGIASGCPQEWIEKGIAAYQEVVSNNPGDADAHLKIGMLFLLIGNRRAAREEYKMKRKDEKNT